MKENKKELDRPCANMLQKSNEGTAICFYEKGFTNPQT